MLSICQNSMRTSTLQIQFNLSRSSHVVMFILLNFYAYRLQIKTVTNVAVVVY